MNLYQRVAQSNPHAAKSVIKGYGYEIKTNNLADALRLLVKNEGEPALRAIVDIHPDKDIILECFQESKSGKSKKECGCKKEDKNSFFNASGAQQITEAQKTAQMTNTFLIASAFIVITALILKN